MQAIHTKYICATNSRGSRIKATCDAGSVTIPYPHELTSEQSCHRAAAEVLVAKVGWNTKYYGSGLLGGALPNNAGYCFIMDNAQAKE